jgi:porin
MKESVMIRRRRGQASLGALAFAIVLAVLGPAAIATAQPVDIPPTWGGSFWDRPRLTGDWFGLRDEMGKKGIVVDIDLLQVPQGVMTGGRDTVAEYSGLAEYTLNVDTQKLGLWPGGFLNVMGMTNFGDNVNNASGAFVPPNIVSLLPQPDDTTSGLMSLQFMQFLSTKFGIAVGKLYTLGGDNNEFAHDFHSTFLNTALDFNAALALVPFSAYGGTLIFLPWEGAQFTVAVIDPSGSATNNDISEAFRDGVLVNGEGRVTIKPFGLVGHQLLGMVWSNKERLSIKQDPDNIARMLLDKRFPRLADPGPILRRILARFFPELLVPVQPANRTDNTWTVYYNFDQFLWSPAGQPDKGIGAFFRFGITDGIANPIKYTYNVGVGGKGIVPGRPMDTFGVGWARTQMSDDFIPFLRQRLNLGLDKEDAVEMYYNVAITKWLTATVDLQIIDPALKKTLDLSSSQRLRNNDTAVVGGLRLYSRF